MSDRTRPWWRSVLARPRRWLAAICLLSAVPGLGLLRLELRTDGAAIYPRGDPTVERTAADRAAFFDVDQVLLLATPRPGGPALDSPAGLRFLKRLHDSAAAVSGVDGHRVRSLASLLDARPGTPLLLTGNFLDDVPDGGREYRELLRRIRRSELAGGLFLAPDAAAAALYLPAARGGDRQELVRELERWLSGRDDPGFELRLTGPLAAEVALGKAVLEDLARLVPAMAAVVAILLFLCLGSVGGVAVALAEVLLVLLWTLGAMGYCGVPVTLVTTVLPVIVMTVTVTDEIHLLDRFRQHLAGGGRRPAAMAAALDEVARPIVLTSLTTAAALLSFLSASMAPVRHFGLFTALGVVVAMALSFTFVPALALTLPGSWFGTRGGHRRPPRHQRWLVRRRTGAVLAASLALAAAVPGLARLEVQDSWLDNLDPGAPVATAERAFNASLWGSYRFDVVLDGDRQGWFRQPAGLRLMETLTAIARAGPHVGGVVSHLTAFEIAAGALEASGPVSDLPPEDVAEIASLLDTVEARIDLDQYLRWDGSGARLRIFVNSPDYRRNEELHAYLERRTAALFAEHGLRRHFSGELPLAAAVVRAIVTNMLRSVGWTAAGVALLLAFALRGARAAGVVMAPLLSAILLLLGAMGWAGMPLGIATSLFVALTVGVAVDFAVHFRHAYRRGRRAGMAPEPALAATLTSAGRAIHWNAVVLALGLSVLALSALAPNRRLGLLLAAAILTCYATTLLLLPPLLVGREAGRRRRGTRASREPERVGGSARRATGDSPPYA